MRSNRRAVVGMKSKSPMLSLVVEWNVVVYKIPYMKGWTGRVV